MPIELIWIGAIVVLMGVASAFFLVPWEILITVGNAMGVGSVALGVPLEVVYFALLAWALERNGGAPKGWYWRSFAFHDRLSPRERTIVLPWFYLGALCFLGATLGIVIVFLGALASSL